MDDDEAYQNHARQRHDGFLAHGRAPEAGRAAIQSNHVCTHEVWNQIREPRLGLEPSEVLAVLDVAQGVEAVNLRVRQDISLALDRPLTEDARSHKLKREAAWRPSRSIFPISKRKRSRNVPPTQGLTLESWFQNLASARANSDHSSGTIEWSQCPAVESIPGKLSGAWVLKGTRMPVSAIFENLEAGANIDDIMEWFAGLDRNQVEEVIEFAARSLDARL
jgi:uncharacterized protein (DUF433 family)